MSAFRKALFIVVTAFPCVPICYVSAQTHDIEDAKAGAIDFLTQGRSEQAAQIVEEMETTESFYVHCEAVNVDEVALDSYGSDDLLRVQFKGRESIYIQNQTKREMDPGLRDWQGKTLGSNSINVIITQGNSSTDFRGRIMMEPRVSWIIKEFKGYMMACIKDNRFSLFDGSVPIPKMKYLPHKMEDVSGAVPACSG